MTSHRHTERSFCGVEVPIETVININFFNRNRSFNSILFVPHKTAFRMTCTKLKINTKTQVGMGSGAERSITTNKHTLLSLLI